MKKLLLLAFVLAGCQPSQQTDDTSTQDAETEPAPATEWRSLFDGTSLARWRTFKNSENTGWDVVDSAIHCKGPGPDLITEEQFRNFEISLEWKIAEGGNSGIIYRSTEEFDASYLSGPEYQLLDDANYPDANKTGSNYDMHDPVNALTKPAGEWNSSRIVVNGNHVEHWLNGLKVVEYELQSDDWTERKTNSKWKDAAGYGMASRGHIALQDHDHEIWFRNIWIREL